MPALCELQGKAALKGMDLNFCWFFGIFLVVRGIAGGDFRDLFQPKLILGLCKTLKDQDGQIADV